MANPRKARRKPKGAVEQNRIRALELSIAGASYRQIASQIGVSVSTAYSYVKHSLDEIRDLRKDEAEHYRELELERLDDALRRIRSSDGYKAGEPQAIQASIRLSESRRKLLGLDAPARQDVTTGGHPIKAYIGINPEDV